LEIPYNNNPVKLQGGGAGCGGQNGFSVAGNDIYAGANVCVDNNGYAYRDGTPSGEGAAGGKVTPHIRDKQADSAADYGHCFSGTEATCTSADGENGYFRAETQHIAVGLGGEAGTIRSGYFKNVEGPIKIIVGKGGAAGTNGGYTAVTAKKGGFSTFYGSEYSSLLPNGQENAGYKRRPTEAELRINTRVQQARGSIMARVAMERQRLYAQLDIRILGLPPLEQARIRQQLELRIEDELRLAVPPVTMQVNNARIRISYEPNMYQSVRIDILSVDTNYGVDGSTNMAHEDEGNSEGILLEAAGGAGGGSESYYEKCNSAAGAAKEFTDESVIKANSHIGGKGKESKFGVNGAGGDGAGGIVPGDCNKQGEAGKDGIVLIFY
jgi:hypothetical protein